MITTKITELSNSLKELHDTHQDLYQLLHLGLCNTSYSKPPLSSLTPFLSELSFLKEELNKRELGSSKILLYLEYIDSENTEFNSNYALYTAPMAMSKQEYEAMNTGMCNSVDQSEYNETLCSAKFYIMSLRETLHFLKSNEELVECIEILKFNFG